MLIRRAAILQLVRCIEYYLLNQNIITCSLAATHLATTLITIWKGKSRLYTIHPRHILYTKQCILCYP